MSIIDALMRTVECYVRYSSHNQDDGYSVEYQTTEINEFCLRSGLELHKTHIDQAQTGTKVVGREAFFNLIERVKDGTVGVIIVYKLSRMFRNAYESQHYRKLFAKHGVKLMSVTQLIDEDSSAGRLMTNVLSDIDQYQSETTSDHVKSSMREMARQGYYTGGVIQYGFELEIITHGKKVRKKYKPFEKEAAVVRKIFEMYADNNSLSAIQDYLSKNNIKNRKGINFMIQDISRILNREVYIGRYKFKTKGYDDIIVENCIPAIIDIDIWNVVQLKNVENKQKYVNPRRREGKRLYALTGFLKCGCCGSSYTGRTSGSKGANNRLLVYTYYICCNKRTRRDCNNQNVKREIIEEAVLNAIIKNILNDEAIKRLSKEVSGLVENRPNIEDEMKQLVKKKAKLEKHLDLLIDMRLNGEMSAVVLKSKSVEIEAELKQVKNRLFGYTEQKRTAVSEESVETYLRGMLANLSEFQYFSDVSGEIMRTLIEAFVDNIVINETSIEINLKVSPYRVSAHNKTNSPPFVSLYAKISRK